MIQCKDCEFFEQRPDGAKVFKCDPFSNIKEPECLAKWQLMRLDMVLSVFRASNAWQAKMAPLQNKILKYLKRELDDMEDADGWKTDCEDDEGTEL